MQPKSPGSQGREDEERDFTEESDVDIDIDDSLQDWENHTFIQDVFVHIRFSLDDTVLYLYKYLINRYIFKVFLLHTIALMRVSLFSLKRLYMDEIKEIYF